MASKEYRLYFNQFEYANNVPKDRIDMHGNRDQRYSVPDCPIHIFTIKTSSIPNAGLGLFAEIPFDAGQLIGLFFGDVSVNNAENRGTATPYAVGRGKTIMDPGIQVKGKIPIYMGIHFANDADYDPSQDGIEPDGGTEDEKKPPARKAAVRDQSNRPGAGGARRSPRLIKEIHANNSQIAPGGFFVFASSGIAIGQEILLSYNRDGTEFLSEKIDPTVRM